MYNPIIRNTTTTRLMLPALSHRLLPELCVVFPCTTCRRYAWPFAHTTVSRACQDKACRTYSRRADITLSHVLCDRVLWVRLLSTFLFWESSRQETGNYMELTRVDDFAVRGFPVSGRRRRQRPRLNTVLGMLI